MSKIIIECLFVWEISASPDNHLQIPVEICYCFFCFSAKVLVKGEPNVSYICSRYYRAPELIFGATDYTPDIG